MGVVMSLPTVVRASERISVGLRVKVVPKGRTAALAFAVNISLGGMLLGAAAPPLPVGTSCEVAILVPGAKLEQAIKALGTVVRSDAHGLAIRFAHALKPEVVQTVARTGRSWRNLPLVRAYADYFQVSQSEDRTDCEALLGVSKGTLRTVFLTTFSTCIPAAILPVWLYRAAIPAIPVWEKVLISFAYGGLWLGIIQPTVDVLVLRMLRSRKAVASTD
jgi:hypothetical protein